jgi:hypothetical protein
LSGYTGTPNYALSAFNKAMENDLEEQKRRRNSRWAKIKDLTQDADAASDIVNGDNAILASIALKKTAARQGLGRIQPQVEATIAELTRRASLDYAAAEFKIAAAEDKREVVAPRPVVVRPVAPKGAGTAQENLEERKKTNERERLVSVDGIPVRRATKQRQAMTQSGIDRRISYIEGVAKLEKAIKDHGNNIYNVLATDRGDIIADLALSLENSPQGFGYERAISRNAAVVLEEGMGNPASLKAALLKVFGRDPAAGVRRLREDTQGQLNQLLKGLADPSSQRDKDASEYGRWKIGNRIKLILGEKEIAAPKLGTPIDQITALPPDSPLYVPSAAAASETPAAAPAAPADDWRAKLRVVGKL